MPFLSPAKLLVILVVAVVVLGPDKLPKVAKQIGGLWGDFRRFREKLESEVRGNFPELPSTDTIHQAVRSPLSFLNDLADSHDSENGTTPATVDGPESSATAGVTVEPSPDSNRPNGTAMVGESPISRPVAIADPGDTVHSVRSNGAAVPDDPGMN
jgi:sec-independent protein translocase protein TatB